MDDSTRIEILNSEVEGCKSKIWKQKEAISKLVTCYFVLIGVLFSYASFLHSARYSDNPNVDSGYWLIHTIFGNISTILVFCIGWAFQSYASRIVTTIIECKKHIAQMRYLKAHLFDKGCDVSLAENSIMPVGWIEAVELRGTKGLPYLYNMINFLILLLTYFFTLIASNHSWAMLVASSVFFFFGMIYPNSCINIVKESKIAGRIKPSRRDKKSRSAYTKLKERSKKSGSYNVTKYYLRISSFVFLACLIFSFFAINKGAFSDIYRWSWGCGVALFVAIHYVLIRFRLKVIIAEP